MGREYPITPGHFEPWVLRWLCDTSQSSLHQLECEHRPYMYILHGSLWEWVILQLNDLNPSFSWIYFGKSSKLYGHLDSFGGFPHFFRDTPTFCIHPGSTCGFHQWSDVTKTEPENWGFNRCSWKKSYTRWNNTAPVEIFHEALAKYAKMGKFLHVNWFLHLFHQQQYSSTFRWFWGRNFVAPSSAIYPKQVVLSQKHRDCGCQYILS